MFALGVDGVKGDRGDEVDLEPVSPTLQNTYPLLFAGAVLGELPRDGGGIFRAGDDGLAERAARAVGRRPAGRLGRPAARDPWGADGSNERLPVWGSDVGGYGSTDLTADVFARWAQLGAVSPVMEVGGIGPNATPWVLGGAAMRVLRDSAVLHYELFPYFDGLLRRGEPVLRPLAYAYPDDPEAWRADLELLVGPDLLAAPVAGPGTTPSVYLPKGTWVDLHTGATVRAARRSPARRR